MEATMPKCRSCGATIDWVEMNTGAKMPVDAQPRPTWCPLPGQTVIVKVYGKPAFVTKVPEDEPLVKVGVSHFATCPNADEHRGKGKGTHTSRRQTMPI